MAMKTRKHPTDFERTASGIYFRQAEAALSAGRLSGIARGIPVTRVQLGRCTLYCVAPTTWKRQHEVSP